MLAPLAGCTKALGVDVRFQAGLPVLTFRSVGLFSHPVDSICLWGAKIIDDTTGEAVMEITSLHDHRDCARLSQVNFSQLGMTLRWVGVPHTPTVGRYYHAEVVTENATG